MDVFRRHGHIASKLLCAVLETHDLDRCRGRFGSLQGVEDCLVLQQRSWGGSDWPGNNTD